MALTLNSPLAAPTKVTYGYALNAFKTELVFSYDTSREMNAIVNNPSFSRFGIAVIVLSLIQPDLLFFVWQWKNLR